MTDFRTPTADERSFLRIVTLGYAELEAQIESCDVADYDPDGYCDVRVAAGPPSPVHEHCDGPSLITGVEDRPIIETLLWINHEGMLDTIEFIQAGERFENIYLLFIRAAADAALIYHNRG